MNLLRSLRNRLFLWYVGSLFLFSVFFYVVVHILDIHYGIEIVFVLFFLLACVGFLIIYKITDALTYLTAKIKEISRETLGKRIIGIHSEDEIGELATAFNNLLDRLDGAFKREQQFIADVAHELKTPLATLRSTLEVSLSKDRSRQEYKKVINDAITETNHLSSTLNNVLNLAWSETPQEQKHMARINLSALLSELVDIAEKLASQKKQIVKSQIKQEVYIQGNKEKFARALVNIIDNAVKYTPPKGEILVELKVEDKHALIIFTDNGQGILKKDIPHIFDRFYRGSSTDKVFGSGIGLSITQSIIKAHHGDIAVQSTVGKGTTFIITLPHV